MSAKKRALGKGLGALLDNSGIEPQPLYDIEKDLLPTGTIGLVPIDIIELNPYQPRTDFDEEAMNDLAASVKEQGILQPVTVRRSDDNKLQLIAGERRLKAARMAGLANIPAYIVVADDSKVLEMAIVENIQRENLNPIEIALGYKQLVETYELTQEMLSEKIGKNRSSITNILRLLKLPGEIQIGLRQEMITTGHAKALLSVENVQTQLDIYHDIIAQDLSVRETEEIIRDILVKKEEDSGANENKKDNARAAFPDLKKELEKLFSARVQIKSNLKGKGSITIRFDSQEELHRLSDILKR